MWDLERMYSPDCASIDYRALDKLAVSHFLAFIKQAAI